MTPSEESRVRECVAELADIFYRNTPPDKCQSLENIESSVREHLLESVGPQLAFFLSHRKPKLKEGKSE